ncbi:hypothetical protein EYF80_019085 [Liparis tanakae]|uniref:Uncharacterized protein n=1 Tax=Liparis tanakae TaxID=230148 RepID=A0A4Z2HYA8_9TELE|nr:hypothetical protein EYF80_019085 [Liparis tanakae]
MLHRMASDLNTKSQNVLREDPEDPELLRSLPPWSHDLDRAQRLRPPDIDPLVLPNTSRFSSASKNSSELPLLRLSSVPLPSVLKPGTSTASPSGPPGPRDRRFTPELRSAAEEEL